MSTDMNDKVDSLEKGEYVYERRPRHLKADSADDKFDIIVPTKYQAVLIGMFVVLFLIQFIYFSGLYLRIYDGLMGTEMYAPEYFPVWPYWFVPLLFLAVSIVPILAWGEIGSRFASASMLKYLEKTVKKKRPEPAELILGYPTRTQDIYYLEAFPVDLDLGSDFVHLKVFLQRVMEVVTLSLGISVLISQTLAPFLWEQVYPLGWYMVMEELMIDMVIYLGPFTLLILLFVLPTFWVAEDTQAYRIDEHQDSVRLGLYLRSGLLSKILGFFGLVLVFNLANEFAANLLMGVTELDYGALMADPDLAVQVFLSTFLWFAIILGMSAAMPFLVTLVYLWKFHERWVNNVRIQASEFMDLGTMKVRKPKEANLGFLNKPEMVDETGGYFQTKTGKIVLIVLIAITGLVCIYSAFLFGYEGVLFGASEDTEAILHILLYVVGFAAAITAGVLVYLEKQQNAETVE